MKIDKYGTVTISKHEIVVSGWTVSGKDADAPRLADWVMDWAVKRIATTEPAGPFTGHVPLPDGSEAYVLRAPAPTKAPR